MDALAHVIRVFDSDTVPHEKGSVDPMRDFEDVDMELILSDLVVVEKRMERVDKDRKRVKSPELDQEFALLTRLKAELEAGRPLRGLEYDAEDEKRIRGFQFLSQKPGLVRAEPRRGGWAEAARGGGGVPARSPRWTRPYRSAQPSAER